MEAHALYHDTGIFRVFGDHHRASHQIRQRSLRRVSRVSEHFDGEIPVRDDPYRDAIALGITDDNHITHVLVAH
jgi:hypothetical protein